MDCLDFDEEALELLPLGDWERDPALVDLAEDDLESALDDLAVEAPDFSDPSLLPSDFTELDLDLDPSDFAELDLEPSDLAEFDLEPPDFAELDLDLEPPDLAELDLDLEPSDLAEVFLPEDRDELGRDSLFDFSDFADEILDPTLVATLLLSGDNSRDDGASLEAISAASLDSVELVDILSSSALADETRMESLSPGVSFELI